MESPQQFGTLPGALRTRATRKRAKVRRALLQARLVVRSSGRFVRRAIDIVVSGTALILLSPLFLMTAIAIKLTSRGPVFFQQQRVGQGGAMFSMWKFRTMFQGADAMKTALANNATQAMDGVRFKLRNDPRITSIGRWLRRLSIDELPQIWNVLKGDMTLIGPRPPVSREVALYDARALRRLDVRPGLTCLWQIQGRSDLSFDQQVDLDLQYIDQVKPAQEFAILIKTIPAVLSGRGAY